MKIIIELKIETSRREAEMIAEDIAADYEDYLAEMNAPVKVSW